MLGLRILVGLDAIGAPSLVPCKFFNPRCCAASLPTTAEVTPYGDSAYSGALRPIKYSSRAKVSMWHSVESPANALNGPSFVCPDMAFFGGPAPAWIVLVISAAWLQTLTKFHLPVQVTNPSRLRLSLQFKF